MSADHALADARVPRERFLGPGPWQVCTPLDRERRYRPTDDDDPRHGTVTVVAAGR